MVEVEDLEGEGAEVEGGASRVEKDRQRESDTINLLSTL